MPYNNSLSYYPVNMHNGARQTPRPRYNNRIAGPGGFLLPFALGFVSSPLIFGATRPRPPYYPVYGPGYFPYY